METENAMAPLRRSSPVLGLLVLISWSLPLEAAADDGDMRARIEETRKRLEAERALPERERWLLEEDQVKSLEERAANGDAQAAQFLELAHVRMAKLRRERYVAKWGRALNDPDITDELRSHARRMAQLRRVRWLAVEKGYPALVQRADDLIEAERARHDGRLEAIVRELRVSSEADGLSRATVEP
jgi:hypothetical protein